MSSAANSGKSEEHAPCIAMACEACAAPRTGMRAMSARKPRSNSCARASLASSVRRILRAASKPCANRHTASSTTTSSADSRRPGCSSRQRVCCSAWSHQKVLIPSGRLQAASMRRSSSTEAAFDAIGFAADAASPAAGARSHKNAKSRYGSNP